MKQQTSQGMTHEKKITSLHTHTHTHRLQVLIASRTNTDVLQHCLYLVLFLHSLLFVSLPCMSSPRHNTPAMLPNMPYSRLTHTHTHTHIHTHRDTNTHTHTIT